MCVWKPACSARAVLGPREGGQRGGRDPDPAPAHRVHEPVAVACGIPMSERMTSGRSRSSADSASLAAGDRFHQPHSQNGLPITSARVKPHALQGQAIDLDDNALDRQDPGKLRPLIEDRGAGAAHRSRRAGCGDATPLARSLLQGLQSQV
jgi:hypothetical protein